MDFFSTTKTLGILGGGQLGKMLLYTTRKWDVKTKVLDPSENAPAQLACDEFVVGDLTDFQAVYDFGKGVDILTIEIEKVNVEALEQLEKEGVKVYPQPHVLKTIQNKCSQKQFYKKHHIPTASFEEYETLDQVKDAVIKGVLSFPFVWKSAEMGYDGYGVAIIRSNKDIEQLNPRFMIGLLHFDLPLLPLAKNNQFENSGINEKYFTKEYHNGFQLPKI